MNAVRMTVAAWARLYQRDKQRESARLSDIARLANELCHADIDLDRTAALKEAERLQRIHGMGLTFELKEAK